MVNLKEKWENLHKLPRFRPQYPNESVVRFLFTNFSRDRNERKSLKILDIGCGGGRYVKLFAEQGFATYGIDFSSEGLRQTEVMLKKNNLNAELKQSDMRNIPYENKFFDGVVSFGSLYYSDSNGMKKGIGELYRVLKNSGKALIVVRTTDDYRFGKGEEIGKNTFILDIGQTNEQGMTMHFLSKEDIYEYCAKFKRINIERNDFTSDNLALLNSDWIITVEK